MSQIVWDALAERFFETGVSRGVLYDGVNGTYPKGYGWNGLVSVNQQPSGAESNKKYADNIVYVNLMSAEQFSCTIEAFMAPRAFDKYDGLGKSENGVQYGQQGRGDFGFSFRTEKGTAANENLGYVLHLVYGCKASPSEKASTTVNETPEIPTSSWTITTTPVEAGLNMKPTAIIKIDSTDPTVNPARLAALETILYGSPGNDPRLPLPAEVETIMGTGVQSSTPVAPTFVAPDKVTIPTVTGVQYYINDVLQTPGQKTITVDTVVTARPAPTYKFTGTFVTAWLYDVP